MRGGLQGGQAGKMEEPDDHLGMLIKSNEMF